MAILIHPTPGYILAKPFFLKDTPFKPAKEEAGAVQKSEVLAVGDMLIDDGGFERFAPCKVGDVIVHSYIPDEFEISFDTYRMVHFSQVKGLWKIEPESFSKK